MHLSYPSEWWSVRRTINGRCYGSQSVSPRKRSRKGKWKQGKKNQADSDVLLQISCGICLWAVQWGQYPSEIQTPLREDSSFFQQPHPDSQQLCKSTVGERDPDGNSLPARPKVQAFFHRHQQKLQGDGMNWLSSLMACHFSKYRVAQEVESGDGGCPAILEVKIIWDCSINI